MVPILLQSRLTVFVGKTAKLTSIERSVLNVSVCPLGKESYVIFCYQNTSSKCSPNDCYCFSSPSKRIFLVFPSTFKISSHTGGA